MSQVYELPDEPRPSRWTALAVNPLWPLLSLMLGGPWIAWPWFVVNAFAIGSPRRRREVLLVAGALIGAFALTVALIVLDNHVELSRLQIRFAQLALTLWKLAFAYLLFMGQTRSFALYEYYGGSAHNGSYGVLAALVLRVKIETMIPVFWRLVLL